MSERIALYPGSFDPCTYGHLDLIDRAVKMFDHLVVGVTRNNAKEHLFSVDERIEMLRAVTANVPSIEICSFEGLTADFARAIHARAIVRGLRVISDFEYEHSMAVTNRKLNPDVDTVCLMPNEAYLFLSSRVVKEIARLHGDISHFVPPLVAGRLKEKFGG